MLVREMIWASTATELATTLYKYGGAEEFMMGKINQSFQVFLNIDDKVTEKSK